jgi:raffinose/stachyose/melibiose transport system permease protein
MVVSWPAEKKATGGKKRALAQSVKRRSRGGGALRPPWFLLLPAATLYLGIVLYPAGRDIYESFTNWNGISPTQHFVGFENFIDIYNDPVIRTAVVNTVIIAVVVTVMQNGIGLLAALALHRKLKTRGVLRAIIFLPAIVNPVVIAYTWQFIYATGGPLDNTLQSFHLGFLTQDWLGNPHEALAFALVPMVWQNIGYSMIIFLAGLEGIAPSVMEAASLDGASGAKRFWHITWPLLAPALTINAVLTVIGGLNAFTMIFALTGGGPGNATQTVTTLLFQNAFTFGRYGYGTAMACALSIVVAAIAFAQVKFLRGRELAA